MKKMFFCADCIWKGKGMAMSEAEWIQHLAAHPTHLEAKDDINEENDIEDMVKD